MLSNKTNPSRQRRRNFPSRLVREGRLGDDAGPVPQPSLSPKKLYGREKEKTLLLQAFRRVADKTTPSSEVVFVHGSSGAGKTALVQSMNKLSTDDRLGDEGANNFLFVAGKYDQQLSTDPYSALSIALSDLVKKVTTQNATSLYSIRTAILDSIDIDSPTN